MDRRSSVPSGVDMPFQLQDPTAEAGNSADAAGYERRMSPRSNRERSSSEARVFAHLNLGDEGAAGRSRATNIPGVEASKFPASPTRDSVFSEFCRGQPPRRSFLSSSGGRTPPRFPMSRRSTLADRPELDDLLKTFMVDYKNERYFPLGEKFLPLDVNTVHRLSQYLNGSKPLAHTCRFKRLVINSQTNQVRAGHFVAILEHVGIHCEHLAIIAPFHPIEFSSVFDRETGNAEPGSDWEKILQCFPNLHTLTFVHPAKEPTNLTRDTFHALDQALRTSTNTEKIKNVQLDVPDKVLYNFHHDFHHDQRRLSSPDSYSVVSTPLTIVGSDVIYADGMEDFELLDNKVAFGKVEALDKVDD